MSAAGIAILAVLGGLLLHLALGLLSRETTGQVHHLSRVILRLVVRKVPVEFRLRYQEEWEADLSAFDERPLSGLAYVVRIWRRAGSMAAELAATEHLRAPAPTEPPATLKPTTRAQTKPLSGTSWLPPEELTLRDWAENGSQLGMIGRSDGWWIGDWLRYGNGKFGERYARAARITGYDVQSLMNMVYVASAYEPEQRRSNLSWSHHAEVASFPAAERDRWLDFAEMERLSVRSLREEIRRARRQERKLDRR